MANVLDHILWSLEKTGRADAFGPISNLAHFVYGRCAGIAVDILNMRDTSAWADILEAIEALKGKQFAEQVSVAIHKWVMSIYCDYNDRFSARIATLPMQMLKFAICDPTQKRGTTRTSFAVVGNGLL